MKTTQLTFPELAFLAGTRVAMGVGIGLLLANRLSGEARRSVGKTLLIAGAITTIPLGITVMSRRR